MTTITDPTMRHQDEASRPLARTATGLLIGASHQRQRPPHYDQAISGPHRRTSIWQRLQQRRDQAAMGACAIGALFLVVLLITEHLA